MRRIYWLLPLLLLGSPVKAQAHSAILSWTASPDAGVGYNIYRLGSSCPVTAPTTAGTGGFVKLNTTANSTLTFTDSTVALGAACYYVTATLNGAESVPSNTASAVLVPGSPTLLKITGTT